MASIPKATKSGGRGRSGRSATAAPKSKPIATKAAPAAALELPEVPHLAYESLLASKSPLTAYDLIDMLQKRLARRLHPPTVYRALALLLDKGLIHKLESANRYAPCNSPGAPHDSIHFLCNRCGRSEETVDERVRTLLAEDASLRKFTAATQVIEVHGVCRNCRG